jgi:hypothetical protein
MMRPTFLLSLALAAAAGCGGSNFDPQSKLAGVRILATRADEPYSKPGDTVRLTLLAHDGRPDPTSPMNVSWVKAACLNPANDDYFACYPAFAGQFPRGADLTPLLAQGTTFSVEVPADALAGRPPVGGQPPYATLIVFSMACAGHVEYLGPSPSSPEALPFGCFDSGHRDVGPDGFVFAFSRIFVFADRTNENPVIDHLTFAGEEVDPSAGITMDHCADARSCPTMPLDTSVPSSSQERDPSALGPNGRPLGEEIWVAYYLSVGSVGDDLILLYDPATGAVPSSADPLAAPTAAAEGVLFAVVHDNRGGVAWAEVPVHYR